MTEDRSTGTWRAEPIEEVGARLSAAFGGVPVYYGGHVPQHDLPDVGLDAVLRHGDDLVWLEVHDEVVVYLTTTDTCFVLNPASALVWRCLDGESTIGEILADVAEVFAVAPTTVTADFLPVVAQWVRDGIAAEVTDG